MNHEKILKRSDGSKVKISVSIGISMDKIYWNAGAFICAANKRKFDYKSTPNAATEEEILQAKIELWEKLKP